MIEQARLQESGGEERRTGKTQAFPNKSMSETIVVRLGVCMLGRGGAPVRGSRFKGGPLRNPKDE